MEYPFWWPHVARGRKWGWPCFSTVQHVLLRWRYWLSPLSPTRPILAEFLWAIPAGKEFRENFRSYNGTLSFTSMDANIDLRWRQSRRRILFPDLWQHVPQRWWPLQSSGEIVVFMQVFLYDMRNELANRLIILHITRRRCWWCNKIWCTMFPHRDLFKNVTFSQTWPRLCASLAVQRKPGCWSRKRSPDPGATMHQRRMKFACWCQIPDCQQPWQCHGGYRQNWSISASCIGATTRSITCWCSTWRRWLDNRCKVKWQEKHDHELVQLQADESRRWTRLASVWTSISAVHCGHVCQDGAR